MSKYTKDISILQINPQKKKKKENVKKTWRSKILFVSLRIIKNDMKIPKSALNNYIASKNREARDKKWKETDLFTKVFVWFFLILFFPLLFLVIFGRK